MLVPKKPPTNKAKKATIPKKPTSKSSFTELKFNNTDKEQLYEATLSMKQMMN